MRSGIRWILTWLLAWAVLLAPVSPQLGTALAAGSSESAPDAPGAQDSTNAKDFIDKWILNGNSIGSAAGAILGQMLGTVMFPGPVGWVVGSMIGGMVGGVIGTLIDNKIHNAYNYSSFDRPPLESGGFILEGVGPWEQAFYQTDQWVISGGGIGSLIGHFGMNLFGSFLPGPLGAIGKSFGGLFMVNVITGTIGDNLDGMIDLADVGREIDIAHGTDVESASQERPAASGDSALKTAKRALYEQYRDLVTAGKGQSAEAREIYERYRESSR